MEQKQLDGQSPECPQCGGLNVVALKSEVSRATKEGALIPDPPQLTWRCISCKHEWPRSPSEDSGTPVKGEQDL